MFGTESLGDSTLPGFRQREIWPLAFSTLGWPPAQGWFVCCTGQPEECPVMPSSQWPAVGMTPAGRRARSRRRVLHPLTSSVPHVTAIPSRTGARATLSAEFPSATGRILRYQRRSLLRTAHVRCPLVQPGVGVLEVRGQGFVGDHRNPQQHGELFVGKPLSQIPLVLVPNVGIG
jgi:hypothetical protein